MKYSIEEHAEGLRIEATVPPEQQQELLDEFAKCAGGTCSCPTPQYEKLQAIDVKPGPDGVIVDLKVKPGETIERDDIERCLEHTASRNRS